MLRRPASFNTGQPRDVVSVVVRRISSGDVEPVPQVLRPSHSEPLIPADGSPRPVTAVSAPRRRVARDPSANPTPPLGRRSSSSSPAERGSSPGMSSAARGPPRQRQPPPPLALPPPAGGRRAGAPSSHPSSKTTAVRSGKTDRQRRGIRSGSIFIHDYTSEM